jgi:ATP-binding cassette, subfamily C (CFTR/MRP), member 1
VVQSIVLITAPLPTSQVDIDFLSVLTSFISYIGLCPLLFLEHTRSIKPSDLAVVYLLISLACDAAELGTTAYQDVTFPVALGVIAKLCIKFLILVVESREKGGILRRQYGQWPPEQLAGVLSRTFFWWINSILAKGSRDILTGGSLPPIDHKLSSKLLRHRALKAWDQRGNPRHSSGYHATTDRLLFS